MADRSVSYLSFKLSVYFNIILVIWTSCYNTSVTGNHQVIGSSQPVMAKEGDDVILPCHIEPPRTAAKTTVEWSRPDLKPEYVYILQDGHENTAELNPLYKHRTFLFPEKLHHGNISLKLTRVKLSDNGTYKCFVPSLRSSSLIQLRVEDEKPRVDKEKGSIAGVIAGIVIPMIIILVAAILGYLFWRKNKTEQDSGRHRGEDDTFLGPSQSNEMTTVGKREEEEPKDDISTSPGPRKWIQTSKRWRQQLQKLVNIDDCNVTKVGSLVFVKDEEFCIIKGSDGIEVFLGLRDDGTEVAIKRMSKINYQALKNEKQFLHLPKLKDDSIVQYVDSAEDENFGYLALQLCEYSLEEYITKHNPSELKRKQLAHQVLKSLSVLHGQNPLILHRDIKPQNVFIDIQNKAKLSDFGKSRELPKDHTTLHHTSIAGTSCWKAKETLDNAQFPYKRSTDIQVAGMLSYYILSGGHHPFGTGTRCETNILDGKYNLDHVQDVVAKDLIKRMINEDPKKRPTVEECLAHHFFWSKERRVEYLRRIGKEVENCPDDDKDLIGSLDQYAEQGQFKTWKHKFPPELLQKMDSCPENSFGLLRSIHNLHSHHAEEAAGVDLMEMFPDLFGCVYQFAQEQRWNSRPTLKDMFKTQDVFTSAV